MKTFQGQTRRDFIKQTSVIAAGVTALNRVNLLRAANAASNKLVVGVIGCNGRGMNHITALLAVPNVTIGYICDVDSRAVEKGLAAVARKQTEKAQGLKDFRKMLEDPTVDAVSIAMPDHWHTPAAVLACAAGKHVYVEKPSSHDLNESELIVAASVKHKRQVQMGNQRRSWPWIIEAMAALHAGELGNLYFARCWYTNRRPSIGRGKAAPVPDWLDYSLWQGPAPEKPFRDNLIHYNWHWAWHWGTGEMGNNGVHALDLARWGLQVELPKRVTCGGNRYHYQGQDDWETPDTMVATMDFGDKGITWEGQSCDPRGFENSSFGVNFYGEKGSMCIAGNNCSIYDPANKLVREIKGYQGGLFDLDPLHFGNFFDGIRNGTPLRAPIAEGQKSTILCHLGNIAYRTGHTINFDPVKRKIIGDKSASALVKRKYRSGWEPIV
jgi:predicted dehydrogenase